MITRSPARPHICLRCQISLAGRSLPSRIRIASKSTSAEALHELYNPDVDRPRSTNATRYVKESKFKTYLNRKKKKGTDPAVPFTAARRHSTRQKDEEQLDINALGEPSKIIVLRDSKFHFNTNHLHLPMKPAESVDIISRLAAERGIPGKEEVDVNISALRPTEGQEPQNWDDMNAIVKTLQTGFKYKQLQRYLDLNLSAQLANDSNIIPKHDPAILHATPWVPGITPAYADFDDRPVRGYELKSHTTKQKLIARILRECWNLKLAEVEEGIGQFEVRLRDGDLELLSRESSRPSRLTLLKDEYLSGDDESIQILPAKGVLRVTSLQYKMSNFLDILESDIKSIQRNTIFLGDLSRNLNVSKRNDSGQWLDENFSETVLLELGRLTDTYLTKLSKKTLLVSCFEQTTAQMSNRVDVVKRLLLLATRPEDRIDHTLACEGLIEKPGMFLPFQSLEGLNWRDKMRPWTRWTAPVLTDQVSIVNPQPKSDESEREGYSEVADPVASPGVEDTDNTSMVWNKNAATTSSAVFGNVLHSSLCANALNKPFQFPETLNIFSSLVPRMSQVLQKTVPLRGKDDPKTGPVLPTSFITLRFLPDPFQHTAHSGQTTNVNGHQVSKGAGLKVLDLFPPIEINLPFALDGTVNTKDFDAYAITKEARTDVMIPSNGIDIRWESKTTRRLIPHRDHGVQIFIKNSTFDLQHNKLITPPKLKFKIEREMCGEGGFSSISNSDADIQQVQYLFAGLEIRRTVKLNYFGWRLLYTSIEGGRAAGRRSEIRLEPYFRGKLDRGEEYVKAVYRLAHDIGGTLRTGRAPLYVGSPVRNVRTVKPVRRVSSESWWEKGGFLPEGIMSESGIEGEIEGEYEGAMPEYKTVSQK